MVSLKQLNIWTQLKGPFIPAPPTPQWYTLDLSVRKSLRKLMHMEERI